MLQVENVERPPWLLPVSFQIRSGSLLLLSGPSGSGKSLLLRALADLDAHAGLVTLDELSQQQFSPPDWRRRVMYFAAETAWWSESVKAHFDRALSDHRAWLFEALEQLQLPHPILGQNVMALSSGEKQRLALLRGLQFHPRVLLLDEISANLDPLATQAMENFVLEYLAEYNACAIWVTHMPSQIERLKDRASDCDEMVLCPPKV